MNEIKLREKEKSFHYLDELDNSHLFRWSFGMETPSGKRFFLMRGANGRTMSWIAVGDYYRQSFDYYASYRVDPSQSDAEAIQGAIKNVLKSGMKVYRFRTSKELIDWATDNDT